MSKSADQNNCQKIDGNQESFHQSDFEDDKESVMSLNLEYQSLETGNCYMSPKTSNGKIEQSIMKKQINIQDNIKNNVGLENKMKSEVKKIQSLDFLTFPLLLNKYEDLLSSNLTSAEKKSYLLSLFGKEYLESDSYIKKKEQIKIKIKKFLKFRIIRRKMEKISQYIKLAFDKSIETFDENNFIKEIKNYIKEQDLIKPEILSKLSFDISKILEIIQLLISEKNIDWLVLSSHEPASISSYLYYMQNNNK